MINFNNNKNKRDEAEELVYKIMDILDEEHINSDRYRDILSKMDAQQFMNFVENMENWEFYVGGVATTYKDALINAPIKKILEIATIIDSCNITLEN